MNGLKENIILGQLIPAGTGLRAYQNLYIESSVGNIFGRKFKDEMEEANALNNDDNHPEVTIEDIQSEMQESIDNEELEDLQDFEAEN